MYLLFRNNLKRSQSACNDVFLKTPNRKGYLVNLSHRRGNVPYFRFMRFSPHAAARQILMNCISHRFGLRLPSAMSTILEGLRLFPTIPYRWHDVSSVHLTNILFYPASWLMAPLVGVQVDTSYPRSKALASTNKGILSGPVWLRPSLPLRKKSVWFTLIKPHKIS